MDLAMLEKRVSRLARGLDVITYLVLGLMFSQCISYKQYNKRITACEAAVESK